MKIKFTSLTIIGPGAALCVLALMIFLKTGVQCFSIGGLNFCTPVLPDKMNGDSETRSANRKTFETGAELYRRWGCGTCHGNDASGSPKGPSLRELSRYWDEQSLMQYFQNPEDVRSRNNRLLQLSKRYFPVSMPAMEGLTEEELALLAHYLLGRNDD